MEGIIDHHLLGLHHVNETVAPDQWIYWDLGFLGWGALMLIIGWQMMLKGQQEDTLEQPAIVNTALMYTSIN